MGEGVARAFFHGVAKGVAEVQKLARAVVELVLVHIVALDGNAAGDGVFEIISPRAVRHGAEKLFVAQNAALDHLRRAVAQKRLGQLGDDVRVAQHQFRLMEGADEVLAHGQVHRRLAADRGIHRRQQGGGHLHAVDAAHVAGRREAGQVADHAAAQRHGEVGAGQFALGEERYGAGEGLKRLVLFAVWKGKDIGADARRLQRGNERFGVERADAVVRDHGAAFAAHRLRDALPRLLEQTGADAYRIVSRFDRHCAHARASFTRPALPWPRGPRAEAASSSPWRACPAPVCSPQGAR